MAVNIDNKGDIPKEDGNIDLEEFERSVKDGKVDTSELRQGLKEAATVYIDNRSVGNYFERDARIHGSVFNREYSRSSSTSSQEVVGQILIENIEKVREVYVETSEYYNALSVLKSQHVLVLWGNQKFGKQTTALHLCSSLSEGKIFEINPTIQDLNSIEFKSNQSYLIDNLTPSDGKEQKVNNYILKNLSQNFKQKNSYLVITIDSYWTFDREMGEYVFSWNTLPDSKDTLDKHLRWYLQEQSATTDIEQLVKNHEIQSILENKLLPGDLDRLADLLSKVLTKEFELHEALSHFTIRIHQQVKSWFSEHSDISQRIFLVALAILNGCKYQDVDNASQKLQLLVQALSNEDENNNIEPIFEKTRSSFLKEVGASLAQGLQNTERGLSPVEIVELNNSKFQPVILSYVWHEYNRLREPLLTLLYELGENPSFEVRTRAAAAVGELSRFDFSAVLDRVLRPWANSENLRLQRLAALALSIPIFDSNIAPQVLGLLNNWSTLKNNPSLRLTATIAYGGYVGLRFPDVALRDLFAIAKSGDEFLFLAVAESITTLFEAGSFSSGQYFNVLDAIKTWIIKAKDDELLSLLIFWRVLNRAKIATDSTNNLLSTVLWLLWQEREWAKHADEPIEIYREIVIFLVRQSLNLKATRKLILEELHLWLKLSDGDRNLYPVLGSFFYQLVIQSDKHEQERIFFYLKNWSSIQPPNSASRILSKIESHLATSF